MTNVKMIDQENQHSIPVPNFKAGHEDIPRTPLTCLKNKTNAHTGSALKTNLDFSLKGDLSRSMKRTVKMSNRKAKTSKKAVEMHKIHENVKLDPSLSLFKHMEFPEIEVTPRGDPEPQDKLCPPEDLAFLDELNKTNIASTHFNFTHESPEPVEFKPIEDRIGFLEVECEPPDYEDLPHDDWSLELEQMLETCHI